MKILYLHYYILDFRDVLKPGIINKPFQFKVEAKEIAKVYFQPHEFKIKMGCKISTLDQALFEPRKLPLISEALNDIKPANIIDKRHAHRTRKRMGNRIKRANTEKLQKDVWLLRCVEDDLPKFLERFKQTFTTDKIILNQVKGAQHIIEFLGGGRPGNRDYTKVPVKDFVYGTNILKTLIDWKYDNGPFYRYHMALSLWTRFSTEFIEAVDVTRELTSKWF